MRMTRHHIGTAVLLFLLCLKPVSARITALQNLNFGTIAITNNGFASSVSIDPLGNVQVVGGIAIIVNGNEAIYEISEFPANTTLDVEIVVLNSQMLSDIASEETFTFSATINSDTVLTDDSGMALLNVGGQIETSGSGLNRFSDTDFTSNIRVTVNL